MKQHRMKNSTVYFILLISAAALMVALSSCGTSRMVRKLNKISKDIENCCVLCDSLHPKETIDSIKTVTNTVTNTDTIIKIINDSVYIEVRVPCPDMPATTVNSNNASLSYGIDDGILWANCKCQDTVDVLNTTIETLKETSQKTKTIEYRPKPYPVKRPLNRFLLYYSIVLTGLLALCVLFIVKGLKE